ncbi:MAG: hypothetical protein KJO53_13820, partial [Eudoraea sp.]|nr:hypothetical protein [Eudoraea sp.]
MKFPNIFLKSHVLFGMLFSILIASCSTDAMEENEIQQLESGDESPNDISARLVAQDLYLNYYLPSQTTGSEVPWTGDEISCIPGSIPAATKTKILQRIEYYRRAAGLGNEIAENQSKSDKAQL